MSLFQFVLQCIEASFILAPKPKTAITWQTPVRSRIFRVDFPLFLCLVEINRSQSTAREKSKTRKGKMMASEPPAPAPV
jgi:hypothetical protein